MSLRRKSPRLPSVLLSFDCILEMLGTGLRGAAFAMRGGLLVDRVRPHHFPTLNVAERDAGLFARMPVSHDQYLGRTGLLSLGRARDLIVRLIAVRSNFYRDLFLADGI